MHKARGFLGSLLHFAFFLCIVEGTVHYYDFIVKETNFTRLCNTKSMLVVNESFPGPVIRVQKGDVAYVNVQNQGEYGFTVHWHGVHQPRNPWSDGPEYITQCSIQPGSNFTYEVIFSVEEGTLWWHAHSEWTRASVHGAIVIMPANGTSFPFIEPDGEEIIVFGSWYIPERVNEAVAEAVSIGEDPLRSDCYTINGQPGDFAICSIDATYRWQVQYGKTYLLRLVSAIMNTEMYFAIAQHNLTVVGIDGEYVKPFVTNYIMICPGQTMDVLLTADQSEGPYYMAARQFNSGGDNEDYDKTNVTAILEYTNHTSSIAPLYPSTLPSFEDLLPAKYFTSRIRSLASTSHPIDVPKNITTKMLMIVEFNKNAFINSSGVLIDQLASSLNNISWVNPMSNVLLAYYRNISGVYDSDFPDNPQTMFDFVADDLPLELMYSDRARRVKVLEYNDEVEIVIQDTNVLNISEDHPMHLHGYNFYVVGTGDGNFDNETDPKLYNIVDPPKMTTVSLPKKGWVAIRFKANNPGVWLFHCHLDRHLTWGMDTVFIVKDGGTTETSMRKPPPNMPSCESSSSNNLEEFLYSFSNIN